MKGVQERVTKGKSTGAGTSGESTPPSRGRVIEAIVPKPRKRFKELEYTGVGLGFGLAMSRDPKVTGFPVARVKPVGKARPSTIERVLFEPMPMARPITMERVMPEVPTRTRVEPILTPVVEPSTTPVTEPITEPITEPVTEPVTEVTPIQEVEEEDIPLTPSGEVPWVDVPQVSIPTTDIPSRILLVPKEEERKPRPPLYRPSDLLFKKPKRVDDRGYKESFWDWL